MNRTILDDFIKDLSITMISLDNLQKFIKDSLLLFNRKGNLENIKNKIRKLLEPETIIENKDDIKEKDISMDEFNKLKCTNSKFIKLKPNQSIAIKHMYTNRSLLAIHATGSGKTIIAVVSIYCLLEKDESMQILCITPKSLQYNIIKELKKYGVDDDIIKNKLIMYTVNKFYLDFSNKSIDYLKKYMKNKFIIIDEAHNVKAQRTNIDGQKSRNLKKLKVIKEDPLKGIRTKFYINICHMAQKVLLLTATPIPNNILDILPLMSMVSKETYTIKDFNKIYDANKILDENKFKDLFYNKISIFLPKEQQENYPKVIEKDVILKMSPEYYKEYFTLQNNNADSVYLYYGGIRTAANKLENIKENPKIDWMHKELKEWKRNKDKILIFSSFLESGIKLIEKELESLDMNYVLITGETSKLQREKAVLKYNSGDVNVFIISKAGGEGLDLKETTQVVIFEPNWNHNVILQAKARAIRYMSHSNLPKNKQIVHVYNLYLDKPDQVYPKDDMKSIDMIMKEHSSRKQESIDTFMNYLIPYSIEKIK
jgi:SNF2 family DNA or RNA helicase